MRSSSGMLTSVSSDSFVMAEHSAIMSLSRAREQPSPLKSFSSELLDAVMLHRTPSNKSASSSPRLAPVLEDPADGSDWEEDFDRQRNLATLGLADTFSYTGSLQHSGTTAATRASRMRSVSQGKKNALLKLDLVAESLVECDSRRSTPATPTSTATGVQDYDHGRPTTSASSTAASHTAAATKTLVPPSAEVKDSTVTVKVAPCDETLWQQLNSLTNEAIVAPTGRHMFPAIKLDIDGLKPDQMYMVWVHFEVLGSPEARWRWDAQASRWRCSADTAETLSDGDEVHLASAAKQPGSGSNTSDAMGAIFNHPASPSPGSFWTQGTVGFETLRIATPATTAPQDGTPSKGGDDAEVVRLTPNRKYIPVVYVAPYCPANANTPSQPHTSRPHQEDMAVLRFPLELCSFVATTALHNSEVAKLKVLASPAAKARFLHHLAGHCDPKKAASAMISTTQLSSVAISSATSAMRAAFGAPAAGDPIRSRAKQTEG